MVLNKIPNGRRFSPLTIALLVALIVYSLILLKRIRKQQQISSHSKYLHIIVFYTGIIILIKYQYLLVTTNIYLIFLKFYLEEKNQ